MSPDSRPARPVTLFYSYSHKDEALRDELQKHLALMKRQGVISEWHDRKITAGSEWAGQIDERLEMADVILLLISADFLDSQYCYDVEMQHAMRRHETRDAVVAPIILRPVDWHNAPFGKLQALPANGKAITTWDNRDEALKDVADGIRRLVESLRDSDDGVEAKFADCMREGREHLSAKDFERARRSFAGALTLKPGQADAHFLRGYCRYQLGAYADAVGDLILGRQGDREHNVLLFRASAFYHLAEYDHAKQDCDLAIEVNPLEPQAYVLRANISEATGNPRQAIANLTQALNLGPRQAEIWLRRGDLLAQMGERARARDDYRRAAECSSDPDFIRQARSKSTDLSFSPVQIPDTEIVGHLSNVAHIRSIRSFTPQVETHPLGMRMFEAATGSSRLFTWAELTNVFPLEWVENYASGQGVTIEGKQRDRLLYATVTEPDGFDPLVTPEVPSPGETDSLFQDFDEIRQWILSRAGASDRHDGIDETLPRIVNALRLREAQGSQQIVRIPLTDISAVPSDVSLALMFADLAVLIEDSEHTPDEAKTKPLGEMRILDRWPMKEGEVVSGSKHYLSYELSWTDRYDELFRDLRPLIEAQRVLYLPLPFSTFQHSNRTVTLRMLGALAWLKPLVRHATEADLARLHPVVNIDLPLISGLKLTDLAQVLSDEMDRLSEVRVALREAFSVARSQSEESREPLDHIFRDIVDAKVKTLRRTLDRVKARPSFQRTGASIDVASVDVLGLFGAERQPAELIKLLFGESADGFSTYLLGIGDPPAAESSDPFHVLLRLASASNPALVARRKYDASSLWKRPVVEATSSRVVTSVTTTRVP